MHPLIHLLGIDTQASWAYDFWSGIGTQIAPAVLAGAWWHRNNCHRPRCPRIGRHTTDAGHWCRHHRPAGDPS